MWPVPPRGGGRAGPCLRPAAGQAAAHDPHHAAAGAAVPPDLDQQQRASGLKMGRNQAGFGAFGARNG